METQIGVNSIKALMTRAKIMTPKSFRTSCRNILGTETVFIADQKTGKWFGAFVKHPDGREVTKVYRNQPNSFSDKIIYIDEGDVVKIIERSREGNKSAGTLKIETSTLDASKGCRKATITNEIVEHSASFEQGKLKHTKVKDFEHKTTKRIIPWWNIFKHPSLEELKIAFLQRTKRPYCDPEKKIIYG